MFHKRDVRDSRGRHRNVPHLLSLLVLLAACSSSGPGLDPDDDDDKGPSGSGMARLTIAIKSPAGTQSLAQARVTVFNRTTGSFPMQRAEGYGIANAFFLVYSEEAGVSNERSQDFPVGTRLAVIAQENNPAGFPSTSNGESPFPGVKPVEFLRFTGDFVTGDIGNDNGTLNFVLNGDRRIEAEYVEMGTLALTTTGPGILKIDGCTTQAMVITDNFDHWCNTLVSGSGFTLQSGETPRVTNYTWFRSNSTITARAIDWPEASIGCAPPAVPTCWVFQSWSGGQASGKVSTFTFTAGNHIDARLTFQNTGG